MKKLLCLVLLAGLSTSIAHAGGSIVTNPFDDQYSDKCKSVQGTIYNTSNAYIQITLRIDPAPACTPATVFLSPGLNRVTIPHAIPVGLEPRSVKLYELSGPHKAKFHELQGAWVVNDFNYSVYWGFQRFSL